MNHRKPYRRILPSLCNGNDVNRNNYHTFEIRLTAPNRNPRSKYEVVYDDKTQRPIVIALPDTVTTDETLDDGDWIMKGVTLLLNSNKFGYTTTVKKRLTADVFKYVIELRAVARD